VTGGIRINLGMAFVDTYAKSSELNHFVEETFFELLFLEAKLTLNSSLTFQASFSCINH